MSDDLLQDGDGPRKTASEVYTSRYRKIERETDKFGRLIGVKRLEPAQQMKLIGMTTDLTGSSTMTDAETGKEFNIPDRAPFMIAAAVCEIDGNPVTFPKSRGELDAIFNRLDNEGVEAAATALGRIMPGDEGAEASKN